MKEVVRSDDSKLCRSTADHLGITRAVPRARPKISVLGPVLLSIGGSVRGLDAIRDRVFGAGVYSRELPLERMARDGRIMFSNFTKTGSGTLLLTGNNTYGGETHVDGGTLAIISASNLGSGPSTSTVFIDGATLATLAEISLDRRVRPHWFNLRHTSRSGRQARSEFSYRSAKAT